MTAAESSTAEPAHVAAAKSSAAVPTAATAAVSERRRPAGDPDREAKVRTINENFAPTRRALLNMAVLLFML